MSAAARSATAAAPMAIPAIAPEERLDEWLVLAAATVVVAAAVATEDVEDGFDVEVGVKLELLENGSGVLSDGQASLGSSIKLEFSASCRCTASDSFALGLMTPTMP
jgi:hypothetical protein